MSWVKERKIAGYGFGSYDNEITMRMLTMSPEECRELMFTHDFEGNAMKKTRLNTFTYTASPTGEGSWMHTVTYSVENCVVQDVILRKDCRECPITAPTGVLTKHLDSTSVVTETLPMLQSDENYALKKVHEGTGIITHLKKNSLKISD